jgi:hypothetical protein
MKTVRALALVLVACSLAFACAPDPDEAEMGEQTFTADEEALEQLPPIGEAEAEAEATDTAMADDAWVDPGGATTEELAAVAGMTPEAADALVAGRPYADMTAVDAALAEHLDEAARETVYEALWLPIDLNTASAEEIELIPGVGPRMRHEFEEYRPYRAIEQFRREIGKYVDDDEVARLESYVTLD